MVDPPIVDPMKMPDPVCRSGQIAPIGTGFFEDISDRSGIRVGNYLPMPPMPIPINDHSRLAFSDLNGDGYDDIVVGTYLTDSAGVNTATLFMGGPGGVTTTGLELYSEALATAGSGTEVGIPGDVNGDGFDDVVIGAPGYERGAGAGAVYVYLGGASPRGGDARIQVLVPSESHRFFGASVASL